MIYLPDALQHVRLALVITVGAHTEVHLVRARVTLEGFAHAENRVLIV